MTVWTDGRALVAFGSHGLSVHREGRAERLLDDAALALGEPNGTRQVLAVAADASQALVVDGRGRVVVVSLTGAPSPEVLPGSLLDVVALDAERFAAARIVRIKGRDVTRLAIGRLPRKPRERWTVDLDPARPGRTSWPDKHAVDGEPLEFQRGRCSTTPGDVRVERSAFGVGLACAQSGTVAIVRNGARSLEAVHRVPVATGGRTWAACASDGAVAAVIAKTGKGLLVSIARDGTVRAMIERDALVMGGVLDDGRIAYLSGSDLRIADGETLEDLENHDLGDEWGTHASLAIVHDGSALAVAEEGHVIFARREGATYEVEAVALPRTRPKSDPPLAPSERPAVLPTWERIRGPAQLSLDPTRPAIDWTFEAGRSFEIELPVVSVGGAAAGLYVEIAGDAIDRGLVAPAVAEMNGCSSALPSARPFRCELRDAPVQAGVVLPNAKRAEERFAAAPEDVFFRLRVRGEARTKGRGLLTVRVGFLGEGTNGSLMRGRSIDVV